MAPLPILHYGSTNLMRRAPAATFGDWRDSDNIESFIVEGWGEGFLLGALLIMSVITIANMRRGVLLHKLILMEVRVQFRITMGFC